MNKPQRQTAFGGGAVVRVAEPPSLLARAGALSAFLFGEAERADASGRIAPGTWDAVFDAGLSSAPLPARHGGEDLGEPTRHAELARVLRLIGAGDLSVGRLFEGHVNAIALVCRYGTEEQIADLAASVRGGALSAVWGADDAEGLRAERAERAGQGWQLRGRKILASGAGFVTRPLVTAKSDEGQVLVLLQLGPDERADITGWTARGMRSTATGTVELSGLQLPPGAMVGLPGDLMRQPHFSGGAWRFCAVQLGAADRIVDLFGEHLRSRGRDGDPYQLQRVTACVAATTTAGFWVAEAARRLAEGCDDPELTVAFANLTRTVCERAMLDVMEAVQRGVGLGSFIRPHPIERITRDLSTYLRQPVPDLAMADAGRAVLASARPIGDLWSGR